MALPSPASTTSSRPPGIPGGAEDDPEICDGVGRARMFFDPPSPPGKAGPQDVALDDVLDDDPALHPEWIDLI